MKTPLFTVLLGVLVFARAFAAAPTHRADAAKAVDYVNTGIFKQTAGNLKGAVQDFDRAIRLDPRSVLALTSRGDAQRLRGLPTSAAADYEHALRLDPHWPPAIEGLRIVREGRPASGQRDPATPALAPAPAFGINSRVGARGVSNPLLAGQNPLVMAAGEKYYDGDYAGAIEAYNRAIAAAPGDPQLLVWRAQAKRQTEDFAGALSDASGAIALNPTFVPGYRTRAGIRSTTGDLEGAKADLDTALQCNPDDPGTRWARAYLFYLLKDWRQAGEECRRYCAENGTAEDYVRATMYWTRWHLGEGAAADEELAAYARQPSQADPKQWPSMLIAFLAGRWKEEDLLKAADATDPRVQSGRHCEAWYHLGMKALFAGDRPTAVKYFHQCLETGEKTFYEFAWSRSELDALGPPGP